MFRKNFVFNRQWRGKPYAVKQVAPVVTEEADRRVVVTRIEQTKIISRMLIALIHGIENKPNLSRYDRQLSTVNRQL